MKKIITTLTAVTFALGLAAAAQAQVAKTPEKPAVQSTQAVQPQATKEAAKSGEPVAKETTKPGDKTQKTTSLGDKGKVEKDAKKVAPKGKIEKKADAPMEKTQGGTK